MAEMTLPPLVGTRRRARALLDELPAQLEHVTVYVDCRELLAGSESFADELILELLVERRADAVVATSVGLEFAGYLEKVAGEHGVSPRLVLDRVP